MGLALRILHTISQVKESRVCAKLRKWFLEEIFGKIINHADRDQERRGLGCKKLM